MHTTLDEYKRKQRNILNQLAGYKSGNPNRFKTSVFSDCHTEIAVDNRKRKIIREM